MHPVFDLNFWRSAITLASFFIFIGIFLWAYAPKRRADFQEAAMLPFHTDKESS